MEGNRGIFVKVNYKNIGELNSFIYDSMNGCLLYTSPSPRDRG